MNEVFASTLKRASITTIAAASLIAGSFGAASAAEKVSISPEPVDEIHTSAIAQPELIRAVSPMYPIGALENEREGSVLVSLKVGASGAPYDVTALESEGFGRFEVNAVKALERFRYSVPSKNNVGRELRYRVVYRLAD